jgi:hypothetical protein
MSSSKPLRCSSTTWPGQVVEEHLSGLANEEVAESETFYVRHLHKEEKLV